MRRVSNSGFVNDTIGLAYLSYRRAEVLLGVVGAQLRNA